MLRLSVLAVPVTRPGPEPKSQGLPVLPAVRNGAAGGVCCLPGLIAVSRVTRHCRAAAAALPAVRASPRVAGKYALSREDQASIPAHEAERMAKELLDIFAVVCDPRAFRSLGWQDWGVRTA
jgi:hypothetical protein